ncbi:hypothetical protein, partial [Staphylococcus saprophyticus]|uniref:hypothetical protein n=1 Tax=Staphylococcus saprophyticus TaxID=29385 RepID=UPI001C92EC13
MEVIEIMLFVEGLVDYGCRDYKRSLRKNKLFGVGFRYWLCDIKIVFFVLYEKSAYRRNIR